jgi:hypothetical protein
LAPEFVRHRQRLGTAKPALTHGFDEGSDRGRPAAGWVYGWGPEDDAGSIAAIRHAVRRGVNWIDTAARVVGAHPKTVARALKQLRAIDLRAREVVAKLCRQLVDVQADVLVVDEDARIRRRLRPEVLR